MWEKIKKFFGFLDTDKDGKIEIQDVDTSIKNANEQINASIDEVRAEVKKRIRRIKEESVDVKVAAKEVGNQLGDIVDAAKGKGRPGRKKNK